MNNFKDKITGIVARQNLSTARKLVDVSEVCDNVEHSYNNLREFKDMVIQSTSPCCGARIDHEVEGIKCSMCRALLVKYNETT